MFRPRIALAFRFSNIYLVQMCSSPRTVSCQWVEFKDFEGQWQNLSFQNANMKISTLITVVTPLVAARPQHAHGTAPIAAAEPVIGDKEALKRTSTPKGCFRLATDVEWPSEAVWKQTFKDLIPRSKTLAKGVSRPDWKLRAFSY